MKKLIIIRGPLGVGKSTVSEFLAQKISAGYISLDEIIREHDLEGTNGIPVEIFLQSNEIIFDLIAQENGTFILDGCFYYQEQIDDLQQKFNNDISIFTLISSVEICIQRDAKRQRVYGEDSARFVHMITTKVKAGEEVDNSNLTVEETVQKIREKL